MKDKYSTNNEYSIDEGSSRMLNGSLRQKTDLFDDDSYVPNKLIRARAVPLPGNSVDWEIIENNNIVMTLKGVRFSKKEREYLKTYDGMMFIIEGYKKGWKSIAEFKRQLKKQL